MGGIKRWGTVGLLGLLCQTGMAERFMCPGSTQFVNAGDTIDQVIAVCGAPAQRDKKQAENVTWHYHQMAMGGQPLMDLAVKFVRGRVVGLTVNQGPRHAETFVHQLTYSVTHCPGGFIRIGDPIERVYKRCGKANEVVIDPSERGEQEVLQYQPQSYMPVQAFLFREGHLASVT